jgi:hypothetical protein
MPMFHFLYLLLHICFLHQIWGVKPLENSRVAKGAPIALQLKKGRMPSKGVWSTETTP